MGLSELKSMLSDNHEATAELAGIEQTIQANLGRITDLETQVGSADNKLNEAIASRDKVRSIVKQELGIDEFTSDAVRMKLSTYASDDAIAARDKQFNEFKASTGLKIEGLEKQVGERDASIKGQKLQLAISGTDVMSQTKGEHANKMLMDWISKDAVFDQGGNISYQGEAGETLYNSNGDPLTLDDRINEIKGDQSRDFVFQSRFLSGGGAPTEKVTTGPAGASGGGRFVRSKMSFNEQKDYRSKYGEAAYLALPLV